MHAPQLPNPRFRRTTGQGALVGVGCWYVDLSDRDTTGPVDHHGNLLPYCLYWLLSCRTFAPFLSQSI